LEKVFAGNPEVRKQTGFEMWFKDSAIDSLSEDKVTISVSSDTAKDYIEENYMP